LNTDTACGSNAISVQVVAEIYHCMELCDNIDTCEKFAFVDETSTCSLYPEVGNVNINQAGTICGVQTYLAPHTSYTYTVTESINKTLCNVTDGGELFADIDLTETKMLTATFDECVSLCNTRVGCSAFDYYGNNTCRFHTGVVEAITYTGDEEIHQCFLKDEELLGEFVKHEDNGCGDALVDTEFNAEFDEHTCYLLCHDRNDCAGFEYVPSSDSCFMYSSVTLGAFVGRDCYKRGSSINTLLNYHTGRLIFTEATFVDGTHDEADFLTYIGDLLELVLARDVTITSAVSETYGIVVDFLVNRNYPFALTREATYFLLGKIVESGDPYALGLQVLGSSNPAPPTSAPSKAPTNAPTSSPTTGVPSVSPTASPTLPASELTHRFGIHENSKCGEQWEHNFTGVDVFTCMEHCDNIPTCTHATFDDNVNECHTFEAGNTAIEGSQDDGVYCFEKKYHSPLTAYTLTDDVKCVGDNVFTGFDPDIFTGFNDPHDCASICNAYFECHGYNLGDDDTCEFWSDKTSESANMAFKCYTKSLDVVGAYIGHDNSACGNDVIAIDEGVDLEWHSCYNTCSDDHFCAGYEYVSTIDTCIYYGSVTLTLATGKKCYVRTFTSDPVVGKHVGRLHFTDATWNASMHESLPFKQYMEDVIEDILGQNVTILEVYEGSVVVEYLVESDTGALSGQQVFLVRDRIINDGTYDLGTHLLGGVNPPPPTATPTTSPTTTGTGSPTTTVPTGAPTDAPTGAPTGATTTAVPTGTPTSPPTSAISGVFGNHHTIEIVSFVLIGMAGVVFLYVGLRVMYIWCTGSYNQL